MALCAGQPITKQEAKKKPATKRTPGPYALFIRSRKSLFAGDIAEFARRCACEWRNLSEEEREKFRKQALALRKPKKQNPQSAAYLKFVTNTYRCLRRNHPDWTAKRIRQELMKNYRKLKCKCSKK